MTTHPQLIALAQARENLIDLMAAWAEETIDPADPRSVERRGELLWQIRATRRALAARELHEVPDLAVYRAKAERCYR
ncbi:MAG TPA: hypothetical protein VNJ02_01255 [Vicinamibacterales bacterium]|nr:hypothetical protein [Vicinamibacterales bacterium]